MAPVKRRGEKRPPRLFSAAGAVSASAVALLLVYGLGRDRLEAAGGRLYAASSAALGDGAGALRGPAMLGLTVTTLHYGGWDMGKVVHNCRMIAPTRHRFIVYTDNMAAAYCTLCECRRFRRSHCPPPDARPDAVNLCEKQRFVVARVRELREFAFLDSDLVIMKEFFLDRLFWRSRAHDYLASYDGHSYRRVPRHRGFFNSGLFFMRFVPTANYSDFVPSMYRLRIGNDQSVTTRFIHQHYDNWDTLSWRWHCRNVLSQRQDIPVGECYTIHDRIEDEKLRGSLNHTLLTIP